VTRHTVDSITSDDLDALYDRVEHAEAVIARVRRLCNLTIDASTRTHAIDQARDTLTLLGNPTPTPHDLNEHDRHLTHSIQTALHESGYLIPPAALQTITRVAVEICNTELAERDARTWYRRLEKANDAYADQRQHAEQAEAARAAAVRNRAEAQRDRDRDQHAAVLAEVLATFTHKTHPGRPCLQSSHINVETVDRWRSVVAPTVERPWWVTVAEIRAELEQAQAALDRVRDVAEDIRRDAPWTANHDNIADHIHNAIDGTRT